MRLVFILSLVLLALGCNIASVSVVTTSTPEPTTTLAPTPTPLPTQTPEPEEVSLTCDQIINEALSQVGSICDSTDRNEACYGSDQVNAELLPNAQATFEQVGDLTSLYNLRRISTAPWNDDTRKWGLAVLKAQVNLPENLPGQNVTFLLYGGATLDGVTPRMEAVILNTGIGGTTCADAPPSAALVQAPLGSVVSLNINGADLIIGSTLYITAEQNEEMSIGTIDGTVIVEAMGQSQIVAPGAKVTMPLDDDLMVAGPPSEPQPFDLEIVEVAPLQLLPDEVDIPDPIIVEVESTEEVTDTATPTSTTTITPTITRTPTRTSTPLAPCFPRADWPFRYTVARGDTLSRIAQRAGISVTQLQAGNCIANVNQIFTGQVLRVPVRLISTDTPTPTATDTPSITPDPVYTEEPEFTEAPPDPTVAPDPTATYTDTPDPTPIPIPTDTPTTIVVYSVPTVTPSSTPITLPTICTIGCDGGGGPVLTTG